MQNTDTTNAIAAALIHIQQCKTRSYVTQDKRRQAEITFDGPDNPEETSQPCTNSTYTKAVHLLGGPLGVFRPCLQPLKACCTLGKGRQVLLVPR